jgi:hypothetical protein
VCRTCAYSWPLCQIAAHTQQSLSSGVVLHTAAPVDELQCGRAASAAVPEVQKMMVGGGVNLDAAVTLRAAECPKVPVYAFDRSVRTCSRNFPSLGPGRWHWGCCEACAHGAAEPLHCLSQHRPWCECQQCCCPSCMSMTAKERMPPGIDAGGLCD